MKNIKRNITNYIILIIFIIAVFFAAYLIYGSIKSYQAEKEIAKAKMLLK
jgi:hypothetical protein